MLPCTGCFKGISCPFYDSGLCERPYCHFKHVKKDSAEPPSSKSTSEAPAETGNMLQKLISDAVKKVLQHSDINPSALNVNDIESCNLSQSAVSHVIEEFVPPLETVPVPVNRYVPTTQVSYKPTPISELKKRHIPIPYSPSLMKSTKVLAKRPSTEIFPAKKLKIEPDRSAGFSSAIEPPPWSHTYIPTPMKSPSQGSSGEELDAKFSSDESDTGGVEKDDDSELSVHRPFLSTSHEKQTDLYVPTTLKSLDSSDYEAPSNDSAMCSIDYKPTNKSGSHFEPMYVPHRSNSTESSIYEPSTVSNIEPEYRPQCIPEAIDEYHPTSKSELSSRICEDIDITNEINLLGEILENDLKDQLLCENENLESELAKTCGDKEPCVIREETDTAEPHKQEDTHQQKVKLNEATSSTNNLSTKSEKVDSKSEKTETRPKKSKKSEKNEFSSERNKDKHKKAVEGDRKHSGNSKSSHEIRNKAEPEKKVNDIKHTKETSREKKTERRHEHTKEKSSGKKTDTDSHPEKKIHVEKSVTKHENEEHKNQKSATSNNKKHSSNSRGSSAPEDSRSKYADSKKSSKHKPKSNETYDKDTSENKKKKQDSSTRSSSSSNHRPRETSKAKHPKTHFDSKSGKSNLHHKSSCESSGLKQETAEKRISPGTESSIPLGRISEEQNFETGVDSAASDEDSSSTDEDDVTKECLRIFQEYEPRQVTCVPEPVQNKEEKEDDKPVIGKKRVAHEAAQCVTKKFIIPKKVVPNPGKVLAERYMKVRATPISDNSSTTCTPSALQSSANTGGRVRVAHVQNVQLLLNAKKRMEALKTHEPNKRPVTSLTVMHTLPKGGQRIAHTAAQDVKIRATITAEVGGKIPAHIRQNYFNLLSSEYVNFYHSEGEAQEKAVEEEKNIYNRSSSRQVYTNLMLNRIQQIRREAAQNAPSTSKAASAKPTMRPFGNRTVSHNAVLAGKNRNKVSWSIEKPKKQPEVPLDTYSCFLRHLMTEEDLRNNGFPRPHPEEKGVAIVYSSYKQFVVASNPLKRICDRCGKEYSVNSQGFPVKAEECINHSGRLYNMRINGSWQERYLCCSEGIGAAGCNHSDCHVSSNFNPSNLRGFVRTLPRETEVADGDYGVYALDCEMCYTTMGLELTRVTVIDRKYKTVYETLVKPKNPIIDYNTRFSGITEEQLRDVTTSIYDVQSALLSFINSQTILIGHSLDSDFRALKLIHDTVVDTSVVFPHRKGPPYKRALKTLCNEYLSKNIQNSESGHDSAEDAKACMELMLWKIKHEGSSST
ncbi:RNA exonuclease 1 homolog [Schistocerca americana]|uniref:RNA exonuclease 1 homolog n=1 Tax=Schistocerca americana TaxID=7009 RepID=UPI001F4F8B9D|nr:RNA exonuclease 1 homolog [Schistocerca americana]XP_049952926.1 RNA exonuclease 1 homolog [Schistocerca serialis cubense]